MIKVEKILNQGLLRLEGHLSETLESTCLISSSCLNQKISNIHSLQSCLGTYFLALTIAEEAIEHFTANSYRSFDALIGNNSCYTVTYHVFQMAMQMSQDERLRKDMLDQYEKISSKKKEITDLLQSIKQSSTCDSTFYSFLSERGLILDVGRDIIYLVKCFGCSIAKTKNSNNYEEIDYDKLMLKYSEIIGPTLTKKSTRRLVKHWQRLVSHVNVRRLQAHASLTSKELGDWKSYLSNKYVLEDCRARLCMPSLYSLKAIYHLILNMPTALIGLQVNVISESKVFLGRVTIYFEVQEDKSLQHFDRRAISEPRPVYVFSGCRYIHGNTSPDMSEVERSFFSRNLEDIIFAHEVTYPQYPKSLRAPNIVPTSPLISNEINRWKAIGGCSLKDPSDFCTAHVYVDNTTTIEHKSANDPPVYLPTLNT